MRNPVRVEIIGRNEFWLNAVFVEWEHQFPERKIARQGDGYYLVENDWLEDLQRVAAQVFSRVVVAPADPGRRRLFRRLFQSREQD
jgi:uncharacterized protein YlzI (FlbEa/FlbD family)